MLLNRVAKFEDIPSDCLFCGAETEDVEHFLACPESERQREEWRDSWVASGGSFGLVYSASINDLLASPQSARTERTDTGASSSSYEDHSGLHSTTSLEGRSTDLSLEDSFWAQYDQIGDDAFSSVLQELAPAEMSLVEERDASTSCRSDDANSLCLRPMGAGTGMHPVRTLSMDDAASSRSLIPDVSMTELLRQLTLRARALIRIWDRRMILKRQAPSAEESPSDGSSDDVPEVRLGIG